MQTTCQLSYIANNDLDHSSASGIAEHLPGQNDDFQPLVDEQATSETDNITSSLVPVASGVVTDR